MLKLKIFFRKTKSGNIIKAVQGHYLRDDILCGSLFCKECRLKKGLLLLDPFDPGEPSSLIIDPYYLVFDTNIIINHMHILEENILHNVIIFETVLAEVKNCNSTCFNKLLDMIYDKNSKFYYFDNEHHHETFVERNKNETMNDRNDRAIRTATRWYSSHLTANGVSSIKIVLITDDYENKVKAKSEKIASYSMKDYLSSLPNCAYLLDKLCLVTYSANRSKFIFPPYLSSKELDIGLQEQKMYQGDFTAMNDNCFEGQVKVKELDKPILVQGHINLNRAVHNDLVVVELFPESQWTVPSNIILEDEQDENLHDVLDDKENIPQNKSKKIELQPTGRIIGMLKRRWSKYCGVLSRNKSKRSNTILFMPNKRYIPFIRLDIRKVNFHHNDRVVVAIDSWPMHSYYPYGHHTRVIGKIGVKSVENEVILLEYNITTASFSEEVMAELPDHGWKVTESDVEKRKDFRDLEICTIDPPGCSDIDDALHCRVLSEGILEVGVHIADVTHFISPNTSLDKEAAARGNTVYLIDRRIDMIPKLLSSNICSLREGKDRLTFSCVWKMDYDANIIETDFYKTVIRSRRSFSYEEAQKIIDDESKQDSLSCSLRVLRDLSKILKQRRIKNGALELSSSEIRFKMDDETHDPIGIMEKQSYESNSMVEEFMLLANTCVAERIIKKFPGLSLLRRHAEPEQSSFNHLIKALQYQGLKIDTSSGKKLSQSLDSIKKKVNPYLYAMIKTLVIHCMSQASYFISKEYQPSEFFHYGLQCPIYTHFTSPIRRYADIIVHRLLYACVSEHEDYVNLLDLKKNIELCKALNNCNKRSNDASRASTNMNTVAMFRNKVLDEKGYILYVKKNALRISVPKYGLEGIIYLKKKDEVSQVKFEYDEENETQKYGDCIFHSFDPIIVQLSVQSTTQHERIIFNLVEPIIPGFSVPAVNT